MNKKKRTQFVIMRNIVELHYKSGDLSLLQYEQIIKILDDADMYMTLRSEE